MGMPTRPSPRKTSFPLVRWLLCVALLAPASGAHALSDFVTFETGQVRPLALSPDGTRLFAVNTPDNRLEIFTVGAGGLTSEASVPVGMEPVAVAARNDDEVWVVNHLSDSVSIVDVAANPPRVTRTLLVGDEPNDIVFAGPGFDRAFISTAHRGQNAPHAFDDFEDDGIGRADVWAFYANALGAALGGTPLSVVTVFGDKPRGLTVTNGGTRVHVAVFRSGNQTTPVSEGAVCDGGVGAAQCSAIQDGIHMPLGLPGDQTPGGLPAPNANHEAIGGPETGLIVKFDSTSGIWTDELGRNWNNAVRFSLPDKDVFEIDASANPPAVVKDGGVNPEDDRGCAGVGTILFNLATKPGTNLIYATSTEAVNEIRFEGPGTAFNKPSGDPDSVQGHIHEARIAVIDPSTCDVDSRHLNKHILYGPGPTVFAGGKGKADSLATPLDMAFSSDGSTLYVAAFGSSKVGVFDTTALENDTFTPDSANHISVTGGGPSGVVLDEVRDQLYVLTRFDNAVVTVDLSTSTQVDQAAMNNPEPAHVVTGRQFLYDADLTSGNGEASCSSCHLFGDMDDLSWDLGDPDGNNVPFNSNPDGPIGGDDPLHPMKGPMVTQTLRGMANHGPMHWRGDRTGAQGPGDDPVGGLDEEAAFNAFNVAFPGLLGRDAGELDPGDMQAFTDFVLEVTLPPNPIRQLNNVLRADEASGRDIYLNRPGTDQIARCNDCHTLDPVNGFFGTDGRTTFENEPQNMKVAHLRNQYQKVGMFGMPDIPFINPIGNTDQGPQVRGTGFLHDGSVDTVFNFFRATVFSLSNTDRRDLEAFMMAFDTTLAPIVGQQVTRTDTSAATVDPRIDLMIARALTAFPLVDHVGATECDLIVKGIVNGEARGWVMLGDGTFRSDKAAEAVLSESALRELADTPGQPLTFTCVPPGSGERMGIDRDRDGTLDGDETVAVACPATPDACTGLPSRGKALLLLKDTGADGTGPKDKLTFKWTKGPAAVQADFGAAGDRHFCFYEDAGGGPVLVLEMTAPGSGFQAISDKGWKYADGSAAADGVKKVIQKGGAAGKSRIILSGKDASLPPEFGTLATPSPGVVGWAVRVHNEDNATCFGADFDALTDVVAIADTPGKKRIVKLKRTEP